MAQQYLNDGEEGKAPAQPGDEPKRREAPHEEAPVEETSSRADEPVEPVTTNAAPRRQRQRKNGDPSEPQAEAEHEDAAPSSEDSDMHTLEALGFTPEEAARLLDVAVRITHSDEARTAEATRKRLQFAKWLVDQGLLDEFSLHD